MLNGTSGALCLTVLVKPSTKSGYHYQGAKKGKDFAMTPSRKIRYLGFAAVLTLTLGTWSLIGYDRSSEVQASVREQKSVTQKIHGPQVLHKTIKIAGLDIFYREAGPRDGPVVLLLHGFPTSFFPHVSKSYPGACGQVPRCGARLPWLWQQLNAQRR